MRLIHLALRRKRVTAVGLGLMVLVGAYASGLFGSGDSTSDVAPQENLQQVEMVPANSLNQEEIVLSALATVQSFQEVDLRSERSGQLVVVPVRQGQKVTIGQVIAEVDHADLDAQIFQAQARVAAAQANLDKLRNGERPQDIAILEQQLIAAQKEYDEKVRGARSEEVAITETQLENAQRSLEDAELELQNAVSRSERDLQTSYQRAQDAIRSAAVVADKILSETLVDIIYPLPLPVNQTCTSIIRSTVQIPREDCFAAMQAVQDFKAFADDVQAEDDERGTMLEKITITEQSVQDLQSFLDQVLLFVNAAFTVGDFVEATSNQRLDTFKSLVTTAQSQLSTTLSQVSGEAQNIQNVMVNNKTSVDAAQNRVRQAENTVFQFEKELALKVASSTPEQLAIQLSQVRQLELRLELARDGARSEDIRAQEAAVQQAQADLALARANQNKAIIRSPITGTITRLAFDQGDFVSTGELVAVIADRDNLEVNAFLTAEESRVISIGAPLRVQGINDAEGFVRELGAALDRDTNKVEVVADITTGAEQFVIRQSVTIEFPAQLPEGALLLPLKSLRFVGDRAQVLTVDPQEQTVLGIFVNTGDAFGDRITVKGISSEQPLIADVAGFEIGQRVQLVSAEPSPEQPVEGDQEAEQEPEKEETPMETALNS